MNILKINVIILYLFIVKSECGLLDSVIGTVKNTTRALKADIHNAVAYGNELVFGETTKDDGHITQSLQEPRTEGLFTGLYYRSVNAVNNFREGLRNIFVKNDSGHPHKGIITKVFDSVNKKLKSMQDHYTPTNETEKIFEKPVNPYGYDLDKDSKVVRDKVLNVLYRNNTNVLNKLNITESDIYNLFKDVKGTVGVNDPLVLPTKDSITNGIADVNVNIDVRSLADAVQDKL